jgi:hypothetical protein
MQKGLVQLKTEFTQGELASPPFCNHIIISLFEKLFMMSEIFTYQPFYAISHDSLSDFSANGYTETRHVCRFFRPYYQKMFSMGFFASSGQEQIIRSFPQAFVFDENKSVRHLFIWSLFEPTVFCDLWLFFF